MTFLEVVNKVLLRLRENQATSVADDEYSMLIGEFVNDAKQEAESLAMWGNQRQTVTTDSVADQNIYLLPNTNEWTKPWKDRTCEGRPQAWAVKKAGAYDVEFTDGTEGDFAIYDNTQLGPYAMVVAGEQGTQTERLFLFDTNLGLTSNTLASADIDANWLQLDLVVNGGIFYNDGWFYLPAASDNTAGITNQVYRSQDGVTWEKDATVFSATTSITAYGAADANNLVYGDEFNRWGQSSDAGVSWSDSGTDLGANAAEIVHDGTRFYSVGQSIVHRGTSAATMGIMDSSGIDASVRTLLLTSGGSLLVGGQQIYRSTTPATDTDITSVLADFGAGAQNNVRQFVQAGSNIYAFGTGWTSVGDNTVYRLSTDDGANWGAGVSPLSITVTVDGGAWGSYQLYPEKFRWTGTAYEALGYVQLGTTRTLATFKTSDLSTWTVVTHGTGVTPTGNYAWVGGFGV